MSWADLQVPNPGRVYITARQPAFHPLFKFPINTAWSSTGGLPSALGPRGQERMGPLCENEAEFQKQCLLLALFPRLFLGGQADEI